MFNRPFATQVLRDVFPSVETLGYFHEVPSGSAPPNSRKALRFAFIRVVRRPLEAVSTFVAAEVTRRTSPEFSDALRPLTSTATFKTFV